MPAARRFRAALRAACFVVAPPALLGACANGPTGPATEPALAPAAMAPNGLPAATAVSAPLPRPLPRAPRPHVPDGVRAPPPFDGLRTSEAVLAHIRHAEGLRLEAYRDAGGRWTIGYGHTRTAREGLEIDEAAAERLLREDVLWAEAIVIDAVRAPLNRAEFSALVSFAFNVGETAFRASDVRRLVDAGDRTGAATAMLAYVKADGSNGRRAALAGLVRRRAAERAIFLGQADPPGAAPATPSPAAPDARAPGREETPTS